MADQDAEPLAGSFFPDPPPFYKKFTSENLELLKQFKTDISDVEQDEFSSLQLSAFQLLQLPAELRFLVPPEPPTEGESYRVFNQVTKGQDIDDMDSLMKSIGTSLDETGWLVGWKYERLYPQFTAGNENGSIDRQRYLLRFLRSILLSFLELLGILGNDPTSDDKDNKLKDIADLVANIHAMVNEYRPHQARETLINLMEEQLEKKKAEVEGVKEMKRKVEETLNDFTKNAPESNSAIASEDTRALSMDEKRIENQRHMWHVIDEILGP